VNWKRLLSQTRAVLGIMHGSRAFGGPVQAYLSLTNRCNLRCIHCWYHSPLLEKPNMKPLTLARHMGLELPDREQLCRWQRGEAGRDRVNAFIDELLRMGTRRYQFSGSGEVFLVNYSIDLMARAKRAGSFCLANTNGTLLDQAVADRLIEIGFDELKITTMAGTAETYQRTHPGTPPETFEKLKNRLAYLAERKASLGATRPRIILVYVVIAHNYDGLVPFAEFASEVKANAVQFKPVDDMHDPNLSVLVPGREQAEDVKEQLMQVGAFLETKKIKHNIGHFLTAFRGQLDTRALLQTIPCYYGWLSGRVEADGSVYSCSRGYKPLGNINEKGFSEIWNSDIYRRFRKDALEINHRKSPVADCECYSCTHHAANLRVYRVLHPLRSRQARFRELTMPVSED
jgi:radical SAM protein with 4Fe4S-binding SPASM domain